ncbi:MAG: ribbon-helix-helix protein, CopG family [Acidobacteriota bacterium]
MNRVNVVLDDDTLTALEALERATGASRSEHIRRAVAVYVREAERSLPTALREELAKRRQVGAVKAKKKKK